MGNHPRYDLRSVRLPRMAGSRLRVLTALMEGPGTRGLLVQQLLASASALLPALTSARFEDVRVGLRPQTPDELPVIGASSTMRGVYYATGHYRNGVLLAPLTALMLADLMIEGRTRQELSLAAPARFGL